MFKKVLVVEDIDSINIGLRRKLASTFDFDVDHAKYCDKAHIKVMKALLDKEPYDLLITDLSFKPTGRIEKLKSGDDLIREVRAQQPDLKTIIYSIEDRPFKIKEFIKDFLIDGYVLKGRNSANEMVDAINMIHSGKSYVSPELMNGLHSAPTMELEAFDLQLLHELSEGYSQQEISERFEKHGLHPSSLSSIEKRLNKLKDYFMARNTTHLIAQAKDMGLL